MLVLPKPHSSQQRTVRLWLLPNVLFVNDWPPLYQLSTTRPPSSQLNTCVCSDDYNKPCSSEYNGLVFLLGASVQSNEV
jgi:hypothetical protein